MAAFDDDAWKAAADDRAAFDALAAQHGLGFTHAALQAFAKEHDPKRVTDFMVELVEVAFEAMADPHGYRLVSNYVSMRLAVVVGDRIVIGHRRGTSTAAWKLPRWSKDPAKNRPMLEAWTASKSRARDSIAASVKRAAAPVVAAKGDGAALLDAVVADPENLDARRVYADWLLERGDVRGELVHAQCNLEAHGLSDDERVAIEQRVKEILVAYRRWFEASVEPYVESAETRRGLIEAIAIEGKRFPAHAARLFAEHPIRRLKLFVKDAAELARITPLPQLRRVTELELVARTTPKSPGATIGLAALAETEMFASVRELGFDDVLDKAPAWQKLLAGMRAPALTALRFDAPVPLQVFDLLADAALPTVRDVAVYCPSHADGARGAAVRLGTAKALARRKGLAAIELRAWHERDNTMAIGEFASSRSLVELRFRDSTIAAETIAALRAWGRLERVAFLSYVPPLDILKPLLATPPKQLREIIIGPQPTYQDATPIVDALVGASPQIATVRWQECHLPSAARARINATRVLVTA
jgi:uncharacterized protein (TIGR02996 family)